MGVCMGACAKVDKNTQELAKNEKNQIENNLKNDPFEGDQCNYHTVSNQFKSDHEQSQDVNDNKTKDGENEDKEVK